MSLTQTIEPENFYGKKSVIQKRIEDIIKKESKEKEESIKKPKFMNQLLGPSRTWKVFYKQQNAINFCLQRRNGLMCYAFEDIHARRMFLVAHPKVFWSFNHHRFFKNCNTYEIIQEYAACKLYLDIEYEYQYNSNHNPFRMVKNILKIINVNLNKLFGLMVQENDILKLDSSSNLKFSQHIIYQIKNIAFQNNYVVGYFLKKICNELKEAYQSSLTGNNDKLCELCKIYEMTSNDIVELFICQGNKIMKLFLDEGVYTKNRHFRVLGSSKQSKNIPLVLSKDNMYKPNVNLDESEDCCFFIDSLITCFSWPVTKILNFEKPMCEDKKSLITTSLNKNIREFNKSDKESEEETYVNPAIHKIDNFIKNLVFPKGKIRRKIYFADTFTIVYEIQGFRYCENVGREHKSNNIKYVVDLGLLSFYQKCYDPDCANFRSEYKTLPDEIKFYFEDDTPLDSMSREISWENFLNEDFLLQDFADEEFEKRTNEHFIWDKNMTEEELGKVVDCAEALLEVKW